MKSINIVTVFELVIEHARQYVNKITFDHKGYMDEIYLRPKGFSYNGILYVKGLYGVFVYTYPDVVSSVINNLDILIVIGANDFLKELWDCGQVIGKSTVYDSVFELSAYSILKISMYCMTNDEPFIGVIWNRKLFLSKLASEVKSPFVFARAVYRNEWLMCHNAYHGQYNCISMFKEFDINEIPIQCGSFTSDATGISAVTVFLKILNIVYIEWEKTQVCSLADYGAIGVVGTDLYAKDRSWHMPGEAFVHANPTVTYEIIKKVSEEHALRFSVNGNSIGYTKDPNAWLHVNLVHNELVIIVDDLYIPGAVQIPVEDRRLIADYV